MVQPEEHVGQQIGLLLGAAGWRLCDTQDSHITTHRGVDIREFPLKCSHGFADYLFYVNGRSADVIEAKKEAVEVVIFMRAVKLHFFFEQMKGCDVRVIKPDKCIHYKLLKWL